MGLKIVTTLIPYCIKEIPLTYREVGGNIEPANPKFIDSKNPPSSHYEAKSTKSTYFHDYYAKETYPLRCL